MVVTEHVIALRQGVKGVSAALTFCPHCDDVIGVLLVKVGHHLLHPGVNISLRSTVKAACREGQALVTGGGRMGSPSSVTSSLSPQRWVRR